MRWPRYVEILLGAWLVWSAVRFTDVGLEQLAAGALAIVFAVWSIARRRSRMHLATLAVGFALSVHGWLLARAAGTEPGFASQNALLGGLLLAMFAIVPTRASDPPPGWREAEE